MIVYLGNQKLNTIYSGDKEMITPPFTPAGLYIEYLVVAGGGASGAAPSGTAPGSGGGGAGGLLSGSLTLPQNGISYQVITGNAGLGVTGSNGQNGLSSSFSTFASVAGGGGCASNSGSMFRTGSSGASGGGGGRSGAGGTAISGQGFAGGSGNGINITGGGGGAGSVGGSVDGRSGSGSIWLDGLEYSIGGCGDGSSICRNFPAAGRAGYGNGAAGTYNQAAGNAGNGGVVIIRYLGSGSVAAGGTISYSGGYTYHTFSTAGTSSFYW